MNTAKKLDYTHIASIPNIERPRFDDIVDMGVSYNATLSCNLEEFHKTLPSGKTITDKNGVTKTYKNTDIINIGEKQVMIAIMSIVRTQMNETREIDPDKYVRMLKEDSFVITTNCGIIRGMMDNNISKVTVWRYIKKLEVAGFVLGKENTSRSRNIITDEKGNKVTIYKLCNNGRGDFRLYVNKALFTPKTPFLEIFQKNDSIGQNEHQITNFKQSSNTLLNKTIIDNKSGKHSIERRSSKEEQSISQNNEKVNTRGNLTQKNDSGGENAEKSAAATPKMHIVEGSSTEKALFVRIHEAKMAKNRAVARFLPDAGKEYYISMLYMQLISMLYGHYNKSYIAGIESSIKNMLNLHINRLGLDDKAAFAKISRGIYLAYRRLRENEGTYVYDPLTYLRIDDKMESGTLKVVIDKWVKQEDYVLQLNAEAGSSLIKMQYAHYYLQKVFLQIIDTIGSNHAGARAAFLAGEKQLDRHLSHIRIKKDAPLREEIKKAFVAMCTGIFDQLDDAVKEMEYGASVGQDLKEMSKYFNN